MTALHRLDPDPTSLRLAALRTELADLAFLLECRGRVDAAEVAMMIAARVGEIADSRPTAAPGAWSPADRPGFKPAGRT